MHYTEEFPSVLALCDAIEQSRYGRGWRRYAPYQSSLDNTEFTAECFGLAPNLEIAQTLQGLETEIADLQALVAQLAGSIPPPASIRRVPQWGRSGTHVSLNRVLAGNLHHAWRQTVSAARPTQGKILTIVIPGTFSAYCPSQQLRWTAAATLALAALAEQAGYRCALWHASAFRALYTGGTAEALLVATQLKRAEDPWSIQNAAVTMRPGWLRKLIFRVVEMGTGKGFGQLTAGYGYALGPGNALVQAWVQGHDVQGVIDGAWQSDRIVSADTAAQWVRQQIAALQAA